MSNTDTDIVERAVWRCSGCGEIAVNFAVKCDCPTECLYVRENPKLGATKVASGRTDADDKTDHLETRAMIAEAAEENALQRIAQLDQEILSLRSQLEAMKGVVEAAKETLAKYDALPPQLHAEMMPLGLRKLRSELAKLEGK